MGSAYYPAGWNEVAGRNHPSAWAYFPAATDNRYDYILRINEEDGLVYIYEEAWPHVSVQSTLKLPSTAMTLDEKKAWALATYRMTH